MQEVRNAGKERSDPCFPFPGFLSSWFPHGSAIRGEFNHGLAGQDGVSLLRVRGASFRPERKTWAHHLRNRLVARRGLVPLPEEGCVSPPTLFSGSSGGEASLAAVSPEK